MSMNYKTVKEWGEEILHAAEDTFALKTIKMKEGHRCSLQYHKKKSEAFVLISGKMRLTLNDKKYEVLPGQSFVIRPGEIHRMEALSDIFYIEGSSPEIDDVERVADDYGRA